MTNFADFNFADFRQEFARFTRAEIVTRISATDLGQLFKEISEKIKDCSNRQDALPYLYLRFGGDPNVTDHVVKTQFVIDRLLGYLIKINEWSKKKKDSDMISIPLHGIGTVGDLTSLIVVHGIYAIIPPEFLIPIQRRRISDFRTEIRFERIDFKDGFTILKRILIVMTSIIESESDLRDLLVVGTGFTDTLAIAVVLTFTKSKGFSSFIDKLEYQCSTYELLSFYSLLYTYTKINVKYSNFIAVSLYRILTRSNGVLSLMELALGLREHNEIDHSRIVHVVQVLVTAKPKDVNIVEYYTNIFGQIYNGLVMINRPVVAKCLYDTVFEMYGKNKLPIIDFLFKKVWHNLNPEVDENSDKIVLTDEVSLNNSFNVCYTMSRGANVASSGMLDTLFKPIMVNLWHYANYLRKMGKNHDMVLDVIKSVFVTGDLRGYAKLLVAGFVDYRKIWVFDEGENSLTYIKYNTNETTFTKEKKLLEVFNNIDYNVETFLIFIAKLIKINSFYLDIIIDAVLLDTAQVTHAGTANSGIEVSITKVVQLKLLHAILNNFRATLEESPVSLLLFARTSLHRYLDYIRSNPWLLDEDRDSDDEDEDSDNDEILSALIPVLEVICTLSVRNRKAWYHLRVIQETFKDNSDYIPESMKYIRDKVIAIEEPDPDTEPATDDDFDLESMLKELNDESPSIRVYALDRLTTYTVAELKDSNRRKSVSTRYTMNLLLSQLKDMEPYVYLSAIRNIISVLSFDKSLLHQVLVFYSQSNNSIDEKLRVGEVLTKFIAQNGKVLTNDQIREILYVCIDISRTDSKLQQRSNDNRDTRMKMSSLSILGFLCLHTEFGIISFVPEIMDLVRGVIMFESSAELRRAAVVAIRDIIANEKGLEILKEHGSKVQVLLRYTAKEDKDLLVTEYSTDALNLLHEKYHKKLFTIGEITSRFSI